jgi:hypothetical protein
MVRIRLGFIILTALFANANAYQCVYCPAAKYKSEIANNACLSCPANTYNALNGMDELNDCLACPDNTMTATSYGGSLLKDCICKPGFYGPNGGPCVPCATGTYADEMGQSTCKTCPADSISPSQSDAITDCQCVAGYTGPNGGSCAQCALHTYKTAIGPQACTACVANTMTLTLGNTVETACICTPGYTNGGSTSVIKMYSSTACARFVALTPKPSFASVSTRNDAAIGSAILPTYNPTGGPNGKGHVSFDYTKSQFLDTGPHTFNIATNGGFSIVIVARVAIIQNLDGVLVWFLDNPLNDAFGSDHIAVRQKVMSKSQRGIQVDVYNGFEFNPVISQSFTVSDVVLQQWFTITYSYSVSESLSTVFFNGVLQKQVTVTNIVSNKYIKNTYIGRGPNHNPTYFNGDIAGVFFVPEYLSINALNAIAEEMKQGIDLTTTCDNAGGCTECSAGKYKVAPGPAACTNCGVDKFSTATAATAEATCEGCPDNTVSLLGSSVITACTCNTGYTGNDGHACSACVAGQYKTATGSATCTNGLGTDCRVSVGNVSELSGEELDGSSRYDHNCRLSL